MYTEEQIRLNFLDEAEEYFDRMESNLLGLSDGAIDSETMDLVLRSAHSIKGGAAMMGYDCLSKSAHRLEDFFKILRVRYVSNSISTEVETLLLQGVDCLRDIAGLNRQSVESIDGDLKDKTIIIFEALQQFLGDLEDADEDALMTEDEDYDPALIIFEEGVDTVLDRFESQLQKLGIAELTDELANTAEELIGFGNMANLKPFIELSESIKEKSSILSQENIVSLADSALKIWKRSHALVVRGSFEKLPSSLESNDLFVSLSSFELTKDSVDDIFLNIENIKSNKISIEQLDNDSDFIKDIFLNIENIKSNKISIEQLNNDPDLVQDNFLNIENLQSLFDSIEQLDNDSDIVQDNFLNIGNIKSLFNSIEQLNNDPDLVIENLTDIEKLQSLFNSIEQLDNDPDLVIENLKSNKISIEQFNNDSDLVIENITDIEKLQSLFDSIEQLDNDSDIVQDNFLNIGNIKSNKISIEQFNNDLDSVKDNFLNIENIKSNKISIEQLNNDPDLVIENLTDIEKLQSLFNSIEQLDNDPDLVKDNCLNIENIKSNKISIEQLNNDPDLVIENLTDIEKLQSLFNSIEQLDNDPDLVKDNCLNIENIKSNKISIEQLDNDSDIVQDNLTDIGNIKSNKISIEQLDNDSDLVKDNFTDIEKLQSLFNSIEQLDNDSDLVKDNFTDIEKLQSLFNSIEQFNNDSDIVQDNCLNIENIKSNKISIEQLNNDSDFIKDNCLNIEKLQSNKISIEQLNNDSDFIKDNCLNIENLKSLFNSIEQLDNDSDLVKDNFTDIEKLQSLFNSIEELDNNPDLVQDNFTDTEKLQSLFNSIEQLDNDSDLVKDNFLNIGKLQSLFNSIEELDNDLDSVKDNCLNIGNIKSNKISIEQFNNDSDLVKDNFLNIGNIKSLFNSIEELDNESDFIKDNLTDIEKLQSLFDSIEELDNDSDLVQDNLTDIGNIKSNKISIEQLDNDPDLVIENLKSKFDSIEELDNESDFIKDNLTDIEKLQSLFDLIEQLDNDSDLVQDNLTDIGNIKSNKISIEELDNDSDLVQDNLTDIGNIKSNKISIEQLDNDSDLVIENLQSNKISIEQLDNDSDLVIENLQSNKISIEQLDNDSDLVIENLQSNKISIEQLEELELFSNYINYQRLQYNKEYSKHNSGLESVFEIVEKDLKNKTYFDPLKDDSIEINNQKSSKNIKKKQKKQTGIKTVDSSVLPEKTTSIEKMVRVPNSQLKKFNYIFEKLILDRNTINIRLKQLENIVSKMSQRMTQIEDSNIQLRKWYDRELSFEKTFANKKEPTDNLITPLKNKQNHFDTLEMDRYSDIHLIFQEQIETIVQLQEVETDLKLGVQEISQAIRDLNFTTKSMQGNVTRTQMLPFSEIVKRFPRVIRDLNRQFNKKVDLKIIGKNTLLDRSVIETLSDPLIHLLRNAFDHGIEDTKIRIANGKNPSGTITIQASNQGTYTSITITDDGGGISLDKIRDRVLNMGFSSSDLAQIPEQELLNFIFEPGFSTAKKVTELSGRGVGMDVVRTNLREIRGEVRVDTKPGKGTTFTLTIPFNLSILKVAIVEQAGIIFAIPANNIKELVPLKSQAITIEKNLKYVNWNNTVIPLVEIEKTLVYRRFCHSINLVGNPTIDRNMFIVIEDNKIFTALKISRFWHEQESTIKHIDSPLPLPPGVISSVIFGDGKVIPLVDPIVLIEKCLTQQNTKNSDNNNITETKNKSTIKTILIVDDSINIRRYLSLTLEKAGYRIEEAKDGREAVDKLLKGLSVQAVICDIEMPRLDGYGVLEEIKGRSEFLDLPIAMLTSRNNEKHRKIAMNLGASAYFSKPYKEQELLDKLAELLSIDS